MLEELKKEVWEANLLLPKYNLVTFTWGNVSGIDRKKGLVVIKPSGVEYDTMQPEDMVVLDLDGNIVEGSKRPSSDTNTHLVLYRAWPEIGGIVHTHSKWAASFAQAGRGVPALGTTHADYFYGEVPCTRQMTPEEIGDPFGDAEKSSYETETGNVILETFSDRNLAPLEVPAVLVKNHGPFTWGKNPFKAVESAVVLEEVSFMAFHTRMLSPDSPALAHELLDKHYLRKHGKNAYYGQKS